MVKNKDLVVNGIVIIVQMNLDNHEVIYMMNLQYYEQIETIFVQYLNLMIEQIH